VVVYRTVKPIRRVAAAVASACGLVATLIGTGVGPVAAQADPADWTTFLYNTGHSSYNAGATAFTRSNASLLVPAWKWVTPPSPNAGSNLLFASPTVTNGVVYIGAEDGYFYAVNEADQTVLWSDFLGLDEPKPNSCIKHAKGITATATVADDPITGTATVFVNAPDGYLYALNARTGAVIWKGLVDTPSTTVNDYYAWSSPLVANGKVYVGISSDGDCPLVPGGLVAFDQSTGAQVARWIDVPTTGGSGQTHGGSIWSSPVLLPNGDIVVATGNGYKGSGQPLYNESIVRLDANTLKVLDWWQVPNAHQITDGDFGASPTVWTAIINGVSTPMVGACNKNGIFYALAQDDLSAGPIWQRRVTVSYQGGAKECDSAAVYDGNQLIIGGGAATTINGTTYTGSVQSLNPATGAFNWRTGLPARIVGTPTEDGGRVVAAQTYSSTNKSRGVYLLNAATGANLGFIKTGQPLFGQAVFDKSDLIIGAGGNFGMQAFEVAPPAPKSINPSSFTPGSHDTPATIRGSNFESGATVTNHAGIKISVVSFVSSSQLDVTVSVASTVAPGTYNLFVHNPDGSSGACKGCLTVS
jgi:outer membrane protein assembly factor BamB